MESSKGRECFCGCGRRLRLIDRRKRFNRVGRRIDSELNDLREIYDVMEKTGESTSEVAVELERFLNEGDLFRSEMKLIVHGESKPGRANKRRIRDWTRAVREHSLRVKEAIVKAARETDAAG